MTKEQRNHYNLLKRDEDRKIAKLRVLEKQLEVIKRKIKIADKKFGAALRKSREYFEKVDPTTIAWKKECAERKAQEHLRQVNQELYDDMVRSFSDT